MLGKLLSGFSIPLSTDQICVLKYPCDCSSRPWSFFVIFYVILILTAGALPFIFGRIIDISARLERQLQTYTETTIWGDLSESDIAAASTQLNFPTASIRLFSWCQPGEPYLAEHSITRALGPWLHSRIDLCYQPPDDWSTTETTCIS